MFRVTIAVAGAEPGLTEEIRLLKAALVYGDSVRLVSPLALFLTSLATLTNPSEDELLDLLRVSAPSLIHDESVKVFHQLDLYAQLKAKKRRSRNELLTYQQTQAMLLQLARGLHETCVCQLEQSGALELATPLESGLLEVSNLTDDLPGPGNFDADHLALAFAQELGRAFESGDSYLLLDDASGHLLRSMVHDGMVGPSRGAVSKGKQVGTAHLLMEELPAFPDATVDELMGLRSDLQRHLVRFRSAMVDSAREIRARQFEPGFAAEVKDLWVERVAPEIAEIKEQVWESSFRKAYVERFMGGAGGLTGTGAGLVLGMFLADGSAAFVDRVVEFTATAIGYAVGTTVDALQIGRRRLHRAQQSGFYLLYELNENLESSASPR